MGRAQGPQALPQGLLLQTDDVGLLVANETVGARLPLRWLDGEWLCESVLVPALAAVKEQEKVPGHQHLLGAAPGNDRGLEKLDPLSLPQRRQSDMALRVALPRHPHVGVDQEVLLAVLAPHHADVAVFDGVLQGALARWLDEELDVAADFALGKDQPLEVGVVSRNGCSEADGHTRIRRHCRRGVVLRRAQACRASGLHVCLRPASGQTVGGGGGGGGPEEIQRQGADGRQCVDKASV